MSSVRSDEEGFWQCRQGHVFFDRQIALRVAAPICHIEPPEAPGVTCGLTCTWIPKEKPGIKDVVVQKPPIEFAKFDTIEEAVRAQPKFDEILLIKGGVVIDPTSRHPIREADVLIVNGKIHAVGSGVTWTRPNLRTIDATGMLVMPGLVDLHVHFREPGTEGETIATGVEAAVAGGFTTVCVMPNTNPAIDNRDRVEWQRETAARYGKARVHVVGALTVGRAGKEVDATLLNAMVKGGAVAFSDDGNGVADAGLMRKAMLLAADLGIPISDHAEDSCLAGAGLVSLGEISVALGIPGKPAIAEEAMIARDIELARAIGAHLHVAHLSTARGVELVRRAKHEGLHVTAEVTPHHLILNEKHLVLDPKTDPKIDTNKKMNPPLRREHDNAALWAGLLDGTIDAIATDHAPHPESKKALGIFDAPNGVTGLETAFSVLYTRTRAMGLTPRPMSPVRMVELLSTGPARLFNLQGGSLRPGSPADVAIVDGDAEWRVYGPDMRSQSKNTPFEGQWLHGKTAYTIVGGKVVYERQGVTHATPTVLMHRAREWALSFCAECGEKH